MNVGVIMKPFFVNSLEYQLMIKPLHKYLCETMVQEKIFIIFLRSFFVLENYKIATLTYDHRYLQLLVLNNGKRKIIYDN